MRTFLEYAKLIGYMLLEGTLGLLGLLLYAAVITAPAYLYFEHEEFSTWWVVGAMFFTMFWVTGVFVYREQDPELLVRDRLKIALGHALYWFPFIVLIVVFLTYLIYMYAPEV